jgi:hypothetical protein
MVDSYRTTSRTVFWPQALGSLLVARTPPRDLRRYQSTLALPADDKLLIRVGGLEKSKVGFHSQAISCPDAASTATVLGNPAFNGRVALLTVSTTNAGITALPCDSNALPDVDAAPQPEPVANVMNFRSNGVTFQVNNSVGIPLVMTYSDVWNDRWSARVNGTPAPVLRSALAYKAVIVPPGNSVVEFVYRDKLQQLVFALQTLGTVSFLGFLVWLIRLEMAGPTAAVEEQDEIGFRSTPFR